MNSNIKTLIFWVVLICLVVLLFAVVKTGQGRYGGLRRLKAGISLG